MADTDADLPQAKASRRQHQQKENAHEHCQGYVDKNGMWNNGFYCPRWGGPDDQYCCGDGRDGRERYCCPEQAVVTGGAGSSTSPATMPGGTGGFGGDVASANFIPIVIGASVGLLVFVVGLFLVSCFVCPCCPGGRRRRRQDDGHKTKDVGVWPSGNGAATTRRTLSVSLEAEATSAVIAAQALVPLKSGTTGHGGLSVGCPASPVPSSSTDDPSVVHGGHLHCGCHGHWSPSTSRSTVVDIDSTNGPVTSLYNSPAVPSWQTELDNFYNCSCENALLNETAAVRKMSLYKSGDTQIYQMYQQTGSAGRNNAGSTNSHRSQSPSGSASPSPLCLESFRMGMGGCPATSIPCTRSPRVATLIMPRGGGTGLEPSTVIGSDDYDYRYQALPSIQYQASPLRLNLLQSSKLQQQQQRSYGSLLREQQLKLEEAEELNLQLDPALAEIMAAAEAAAAAEADGQRRDSGVLVEDSEQPGDVEPTSTTTTTPTNTFPASAVLPMPSLVGVERIVGRMTVSSR